MVARLFSNGGFVWIPSDKSVICSVFISTLSTGSARFEENKRVDHLHKHVKSVSQKHPLVFG